MDTYVNMEDVGADWQGMDAMSTYVVGYSWLCGGQCSTHAEVLYLALCRVHR